MGKTAFTEDGETKPVPYRLDATSTPAGTAIASIQISVFTKRLGASEVPTAIPESLLADVFTFSDRL